MADAVEMVDLIKAVDLSGADVLIKAVVGEIVEERDLWRINWLRTLLDLLGERSFKDAINRTSDPDAVREMIQECRDMVRDVNDALSEEAVEEATAGANSGP